MLLLYAGWPGYFAYETRAAMLQQVKSVVERAFDELLNRPNVATSVQAYGDRAAHVARIRAGEVEMLYQPVIALPGGELLRLEALARLRDGNRLVPPAEFLPALGDEDLFKLFELGLDRALTAVETWAWYGVATGVSVNMPVVAAQDDRYLHAVNDALRKHTVDPRSLSLELLETGHMVGSLAARKAGLNRFKRLGVRLAQDDLGSGYSSLTRLRHFAFDTVKIDQTLIRGTDVDPRAALQFVQPISDIAHSLGLHVTLEGLETPGLIEAAAQLGVDSGQGYGIARPMPPSEVPGWAKIPRQRIEVEHPTTEVGGLAAHVAWEHRVTVFGASRSQLALGGGDSCGLASYLREHHAADRGTLEVLHAEVHAKAFSARGGPAHRSAWERLVTALGEG